MHLTSFSPRNYPFVQPSSLNLARLQSLQWFRTTADQLIPRYKNSVGMSCSQDSKQYPKQFVTYEIASSVAKTVGYTDTLLTKFYEKFAFYKISNLSSKFLSLKPRYYPKSQLIGWIFGLCAVALPIKHYLHTIATSPGPSSAISTTPNVGLTAIPNVLKIATVKASSTYFIDTQAGHTYEHGFGYDVARNYAEHLGMQLQWEVYDSADGALNAVATGKADMALTALSKSGLTPSQSVMPSPAMTQTKSGFTQISLTNEQPKSASALKALSLSCNKGFLQKNGIDSYLSWSLPANNHALAQDASGFLCDEQQLALNETLAGFYTQNILKDDYSQQHFSDAMRENLPKYRMSFQQSAKAYDHDWQLLVAMSYQESHLEADAISPTGVQGIMMLTNDTAKEMGVTDRIDPAQSIQGGAKYLNQLKAQFNTVESNDKLWFALASYNMGPMAVKNIQTTLTQQGKNGNSWAEVYRYMAENSDKNRRYIQCMDYVTNIRGYLEQIKRTSLKNSPANKSTLLKSA